MCGKVIEKDLESPHQYLDRILHRTRVAEAGRLTEADHLVEAGHLIEAVLLKDWEQ